MKKTRILGLMFSLTVCFAIGLFSATANASYSNMSSTETYENMKNFGMDTVLKTADFIWVTSEGEKPNERYEPGLGGYVIGTQAIDRYTLFSSSGTIDIDIFNFRKICLVFKVGEGFAGMREIGNFEDTKRAEVVLTLVSGQESFICRGEIILGKWCSVTFDIGSFRGRSNITGFSVSIEHGEITDLQDSYVEFSGPYIDNDFYDTGTSFFMNKNLKISGAEFKYIKGIENREAISLELSSERAIISTKVVMDYSLEEKNAVRLVLTNNSDYESLLFQYTYLDEDTGRTVNATKKIEIEPNSKKISYIIITGTLDLVSDFSIVFDGKKSGNATIYKIEAVSVYGKELQDKFGSISSCVYEKSDDKISISGTVFHNFLISHDDCTLLCYKVRSWEKLDEVISRGDEPVYSSKMSSRFSFDLKIGKLGAMPLISGYAIVAMHDDGEYRLISEPVFVGFEKGAKAESEMLKGISTSDVSVAVDCDAEVAIVDVYLDRMTNQKQKGYLYSISNTRIYYNTEYLDYIDRQIDNLSGGGCRVYLRLLVSKDADTSVLPYVEKDLTGKAEFLAVNIKDEVSEIHFYAAVDFLCKRYVSSKNCYVSGFVLGSELDNFKTKNYFREYQPAMYSQTVAETFNLMARTVLSQNPEIDVVLPISDNKSGDSGFDTELLLVSVCSFFEEKGGFDFKVMLESTHNPFSLNRNSLDGNPFALDSRGNLGKTQFVFAKNILQNASDEDSEYYCSDSIYIFERAMNNLKRQFSVAPVSYIYYWKPDVYSSGDSLTLSYVYNYYSLSFSEGAYAFIVAFDDTSAGEEGKYLLSNMIKYINTSKNKGDILTIPALSVFGVSEWGELISGFDSEKIVRFDIVELSTVGELPAEIKGKYTFWDFSDSVGTLGWKMGNHCIEMSVDATSKEGKALVAKLSLEGSLPSGYSDIVYTFDYPEKISLAPFIEFKFRIDGNSNEAEYEVMVQIGNSIGKAEAFGVVTQGEVVSLLVDLSGLELSDSIENIRIGIKNSVSGADKTATLYLYSVNAYSLEYDDESLENAIARARAEARNATSYETDEKGEKDTDFIFAVVLIIAISLFMASFYEKRQKEEK